MPIDTKYGRVTVEHGTIGEDEPVVVFRSQDRLLPALLSLYRQLCADAGSPPRHLAALGVTIDTVTAWQASHTTKTPTSDAPRPTDNRDSQDELRRCDDAARPEITDAGPAIVRSWMGHVGYTAEQIDKAEAQEPSWTTPPTSAATARTSTRQRGGEKARGERSFVKGYDNDCPVHGLDGTEPTFRRAK